MKKTSGGQPGNNNATGGKLNNTWLSAFKKVVEEDGNAIYLTDQELWFLTNMAYEEATGESDYISLDTFANWKRGNLENPLLVSFLSVYKKALIQQKQDLFKSLKEDDKSWQRYAWMIERKFSDWNLKQIVENNNKLSGHVTVGWRTKDPLDTKKEVEERNS